MKLNIKHIALGLLACCMAVACDDSDSGVDAGAALSIESILPESGGPGLELIVNGTGFPLDKSRIALSINGISLPVEDCNREQILTIIPDNRAVGRGPVEVTIDGKTVSSSQEFVYFDGKMYLDAISQTSAGPDTELTLRGENFPEDGTGVSVSVNGVEFPVKSADAATIVVTVPNNPNIGTGKVVVAVGNVFAVGDVEFTYIEPVIRIASISPTEGGPLTEVTVRGENFPPTSEGVSVTINDVALDIRSIASDKLVVVIPSDRKIGTNPVVVKYGSQSVASAESFTYIVPQLGIASIAPLSGKGQCELTIVGDGFDEKVAASINGVALTITSCTETEIKAVVPRDRKVGKGPVLLTRGAERAASAEEFTYLMTRTVRVLAGTGQAGSDNGPGTSASFNFGYWWGEARRCGIGVDNDLNVYVADVHNMQIRKIAPDGMVTTHAGHYTDSPDWGVVRAEGGTYDPEFRPNCLAVNPDNKFVYVLDNWIGGMHVVEPDGRTHYMGWGGASASGCAVDPARNRFFISHSDGKIDLAVADGYGYNGAPRDNVYNGGKKFGGLAVDKEGNLYAAAYEENRIYKFTNGDWTNPVVIAGSGNAGCKDGPAMEAEFHCPWGLAIDNDGNLLVAGDGSGTSSEGYGMDKSIRLIDLKNNMVTTFATGSDDRGEHSFDVPAAGGIDNRTENNGLLQGGFYCPSAVAVDRNGDVYVLTRGDATVWKIVTEE